MGVGVWALTTHELRGYLVGATCVGYFGFVLVQCLALMIKPAALIVSPSGIELRTPWAAKQWAWADVSGIDLTVYRMTSFLQIRARTGEKALSISGLERTPAEVEGLLKAAQVKWAGGAKLEMFQREPTAPLEFTPFDEAQETMRAPIRWLAIFALVCGVVLALGSFDNFQRVPQGHLPGNTPIQWIRGPSDAEIARSLIGLVLILAGVGAHLWARSRRAPAGTGRAMLRKFGDGAVMMVLITPMVQVLLLPAWLFKLTYDQDEMVTSSLIKLITVAVIIYSIVAVGAVFWKQHRLNRRAG